MTKKIFEELPARKHAPAKAAPVSKGDQENSGSGEGGSEKRIRQAVYDIRYRARREDIDLRAAFAQYMQNSNLSAPEQAAVRAKLFGKDGGGDKKESYNALMSDGATNLVANAMFKVFVEGQEKEFVYEQEGGERKYKVRVTDPKNGRSYVRYADRSKITELRQKGLKVEMTEHGDPYEGKRKEVPNKGGLDKPVHSSKRDGDVNDDGKKDGTDKYIYNRRDAINAAIAKKKQQQNEEFLADGTTSVEGQNSTKITGNNVDNYANGVIKINPENQADQGKNGRMRRGIYAHTEVEGELIAEKAVSKSQQKFMGMVYAVKKGEMKAPSKEVADAAKGMSGKEAKKYASTKHEGLPEKKEVKEEMDDKKEKCPACGKCPCECNMKRTYRELLKNKLRAMGMKNPMMLGAPDDEEKIMKIMTSSSAKMAAESCGETHGKKKKKKKGY
jgi:hypothetical protein